MSYVQIGGDSRGALTLTSATKGCRAQSSSSRLYGSSYSINPSPSSRTPNKVSVIEAKISSAKVRHSAENHRS